MNKIHLPLEEGEAPATSDINFHKGGEFNPNFMYGEYLTYCAEEESPYLLSEAQEWINIDISGFVPEEYRDRVKIIDNREIPNTVDHLNRYSTIGWKYIPEVMETPKGNEMANLIDKRLYPCKQGAISYKKNGYRYSMKKFKVDNE